MSISLSLVSNDLSYQKCVHPRSTLVQQYFCSSRRYGTLNQLYHSQEDPTQKEQLSPLASKAVDTFSFVLTRRAVFLGKEWLSPL